MVMSEVDRERESEAASEPDRAASPRSPALLGSAFWGWAGPLLVTAFAAALRLIRLGHPHAVVFDETYYAKDAFALLRFGAARETVEDANGELLAGNTDIFTGDPSFVVHPQFGKALIAAGEWLFGPDPFGWRFASVVAGALSVLILARAARRMTRSTLLGCVAGLLLALDGLHFTHSRLALLDIFLTLWIVAAFACLVADRDSLKARLARRGPDGADTFGPGGGLRWWRLAAGVCLGLACGTKWSAIPFVAGFGLLAVAWDAGARRSAGVRRPFLGALARDAAPAFASLVLVAALTYLATWAPWFLSPGGWARHWAEGQGGWPLVPPVLASLWHYHQEIWDFHVNLSAEHLYESAPWTWLLMLRPVAYYYTSPESCGAADCSSAVHGLGTPAIWWFSMPALLVMAWILVARRDWRAGGILLAVLAGWLPWLVNYLFGRTEFFFYALPMLPFLVLALTMCLGMVIGRADAPGFRRGLGAGLAGAYLLAVIWNFAHLYPVLSAEVLPYQEWHLRMWLDSWI